MTRYLVLAWPPAAAASALHLKAGLAADARLHLVVNRPAFAVYLDRDTPLPCVQLPGQAGVVIGSAFDKQAALGGRGQAAELGRAHAGSPIEVARNLIAQCWGAYVAILPDREGGANVFRDPLGALECLTWTRDGVSVAASQLDPAGPCAPTGLEIDWTALAGLLRQKNLSSVTVPLKGVRGVDPGALLCSDGRQLRLWRPGDFASVKALRPDVRPVQLAAAVDGSVAAWAEGRTRVLCEVSGGLDSAIVLAALTKARAPVIGAINHYWPQPEADERVFARAVAEQAGLVLTERAHGLLSLDAETLAKVACSARPSFSAADPAYDADMAERLAAGGADALFTGQGGDAVFFQMAGAALAGDLLRGLGISRTSPVAWARLARRMRSPVSTLVVEALRTWRQPVPLHPGVSFLSDRAASAGPSGDRHPWLQGLGGVSPAKQLQIQALTNNQSMFGDSLRARGGRLLQPLMSQPVVEVCLSIPAPMLAIGPLDRPFARAAYGDRLPTAVRERRWKGDLSVFFARSMAENIPFLRDYLMDGLLAAEGLIDRSRLEPILHRDHLIWFDHSGELTIAVLLEAWTRWWQAQILAARAAAVTTRVEA
ncbi:asparagine synthase-related protein [Caulobacter sp. KR2-114]|uniref:asparagine synthase-related protein n=1 Tax=Caulobacter sp. KR2-114 TaxID=3400912 RepID=UPI003C091E30